MRVELNIPDKVWAQVLNMAEQNHTKVPLLIEAFIRDGIRPSAVKTLQAQARKQAILQAWGEGLTDAAIAERTGELKAYVGDVRRATKLPPNQVRSKYPYERKTA
ncbi:MULTISPECIES: hypothetical protein [unclassified Microbacterium]|uniref:hypothetical protein n=1 Tax=unclassified Microbacterium TaxID=2609290 RepID=UPI003018BD1A